MLDDALRSLRDWYRERDSDLLVIRGDPRSIVPDLATALDAGLVTWNRDYSASATIPTPSIASATSRSSGTSSPR